MRPLSAIDAIGPAWNHTRRLLLTPRNWRTWLKIGAVAFFAQVGGCNSSFRSPGHSVGSVPPAFLAGIIAMLLVISIIAIAIGLAFFYLSSRLQFVLFEVLLRSDTTVAPIWRRYGRATWHWMGLKIVFFLTALVCAAPILIPLIIHFIHNVAPTFHNGSPQDPVAFVMAILGFVAAIILILIAITIAYTLLHDFGLPSMALESTPMSETARRVWNLLAAEPGPVLLYLLMRFLLGIAGSIASYFILIVGGLIALIPLGGLAFVDWVAMHNSGFAGHVAMIAAWVVLGLAFLLLAVGAVIMVFGYVFTFFQAYALYFLGGRYPLVGNFLAPFLPPPYAYPSVPPVYPPTPPPANPPSLPVEGEP
jgi:hypothetical protein